MQSEHIVTNVQGISCSKRTWPHILAIPGRRSPVRGMGQKTWSISYGRSAGSRGRCKAFWGEQVVAKMMLSPYDNRWTACVRCRSSGIQSRRLGRTWTTKLDGNMQHARTSEMLHGYGLYNGGPNSSAAPAV